MAGWTPSNASPRQKRVNTRPKGRSSLKNNALDSEDSETSNSEVPEAPQRRKVTATGTRRSAKGAITLPLRRSPKKRGLQAGSASVTITTRSSSSRTLKANTSQAGGARAGSKLPASAKTKPPLRTKAGLPLPQADEGSSGDEDSRPACSTCKLLLASNEDMRQTNAGNTGQYYKNCKACRDKSTARKRKGRQEPAPAPLKRRRQTRSMVAKSTATVTGTADDTEPTSNDAAPTEDVQVSATPVDAEQVTTEAATSEAVDTKATTTELGPELTETPTADVEPTTATEEETIPAQLECSICADTFPENKLTRLSACEHEPEVCIRCFVDWLTERMNSVMLETIECPSSGCQNSVSHQDVKTHVPNELFERYYFRLLRTAYQL